MAYFQTPYTTLVRPLVKNAYGLNISYAVCGLLGFTGWPLALAIIASMAVYHLSYDRVFKKLGLEFAELTPDSIFPNLMFGLIAFFPFAFYLDSGLATAKALTLMIHTAFDFYPVLSVTVVISAFPMFVSFAQFTFNTVVNSFKFLFINNYRPVLPEFVANQDNQGRLLLDAKDAIRYDDFEGFSRLINRLQQLNPESLCQDNNALLRYAVYYGRGSFVAKLLEYDNVKANSHANHNEALREALFESHDEIADVLLDLPAVRNNLNDHDFEAYRVATLMSKWAIRDKIYTLMNPPNDFPYGFFNYGHQDQFTQRNHFPPNPYFNLKNDLRLGPNLPFRLQRHFRNRAQADLRQFARLGVYAELDQNQRNAVEAMRQRYAPQLRERGRDAIFNEIRQALTAAYAANPARRNGEALPLDYDENIEDQTPYYQHVVHGAYRYLFQRPNLWIDPEAPFTREVAGGRAANTSEEDLNDIANMWLAAMDPHAQLPDGFNRDTIKQEFYNAIHDLSRAHNRDHGPDDNGPDRPTCDHGVRNRMVQYYMVFLNNRPEQRPLSKDIICNKFKEEMINESEQPGCLYRKLAAQSKPKLRRIKQALDNLCIINLGDFNAISTRERRLLNQFKFNEAEINQFIDVCNRHFGQARIEQNAPEQIRYQELRFNNYRDLIRHLGEVSITQFYDDLSRNLNRLIDAEVPAEPQVVEQPAPVLHRQRPRRGAVAINQPEGRRRRILRA